MFTCTWAGVGLGGKISVSGEDTWNIGSGSRSARLPEPPFQREGRGSGRRGRNMLGCESLALCSVEPVMIYDVYRKTLPW